MKHYQNKSLSSFTQGTGIWQGWYEATCTAANDNSYMGFTFNCESGPIIDANTLVYIGDVKKNGTPVKESTLIGYEYSNIAPISTYINLSDAQ